MFGTRWSRYAAAALLASVACVGSIKTARAAPYAYIPNYGDSTISIIDIATNSVISTIGSGASAPNAVAISANGSKIWVTNQNPSSIGNLVNGSVAEIDGATNTVVNSVLVSYYPLGIAFNPGTTAAFVSTNGGLGLNVVIPAEVDVINTSTQAVTKVPTDGYAGGVAVNPAGNYAYVTQRFGNKVAVINTATNAVVTGAGYPIAVGNGASAIAISSLGSAYVTNTGDNSVTVINTNTNAVTATIPNVGSSPSSIAINPAGTLAYVTSGGDDTVRVINLATNAVTGSPIVVGKGPYGISVSPGGNLIYVANQQDNTVSVISELTRSAQGSGIAVGQTPIPFGQFIKTAAATAAPPSRLAVYTGPPPTVGVPFLVAVQSQDATAAPQNVAVNTAVTLTRTTGTGAVGGTTTCTILAGTSSCSMAAVTYSVAETGVVLTGTRTAGDALMGGNSMPLRVLPVGPTKLAVASVNNGVDPVAATAFPVVVQSTDNSGTPVNVIVPTSVTLSRAGGSGTLGGTLTCTIAAATNSCTPAGVTYSKAEYGVSITATRTAGDPVAAGTSALFTVDSAASPANRLVITSINGGASPASATAFGIVIQLQNASGTPVNVVAASGVGITLKTGIGILQDGNAPGLQCTLAAGTSSCTASGKYTLGSTTESGIVINAHRQGGDAFGAGDSAPFTVTGGAAGGGAPAKVNIFAYLGGPIGSSTPAVGVPFLLGLSLADASNTSATATAATVVTITVGTGTGTLGGTTQCTIAIGNSGCTTSVTYSKVENAVVLTASANGLAPGNSSPINVIAAAPATKLAILPVAFFDFPRVGIPFTVDVRSEDASGNIQLVQSATSMSLAKTTGTGTLTGPLTCTIPAGGSRCLFTGLNYSVAESNVVFTATRTSGDALANGVSSPFTVSAIQPPPTKLVASLYGSGNPMAGYAFNILVEADDASNTARAVTQNTPVTLSVATGTGTLSGTTSCTIGSGGTQCLMRGVKYSRPEAGVSLTVTRTAGDAVTPGTTTTFIVDAAYVMPASKLAFASINGGSNPIANATFNVVVQSQDSSGTPQSVVTATAIALSVATGTGTMTGATTCTIPANDNSCTVVGARYSKPEAAVVLTATRTSGDTLPAGNSAPFNVSSANGQSRVGDADGNNSYDALTDGLLTIRYLFGLTGTSLTVNAVGSNSTRTLPADIITYLNGVRPQLDIDGNGAQDALTDGLLLIRYLFGLRGPTLIANAIGPNATRTRAAAIETYIQSLLPP